MNKSTINRRKPILEQLEVDDDDNTNNKTDRKNKYIIKNDLIDSQSIEL